MPKKLITEVVFGWGHPNVLAMHPATVEFTRDPNLSKNGDCILIVRVDKGLPDLSGEFKEALRKPHSKVVVRIDADGESEEIRARGNPKLSLTHPSEMVLRKSEFVSDRTLAVCADKAAKDLNRALVHKLQNPRQQAKITLTVEA